MKRILTIVLGLAMVACMARGAAAKDEEKKPGIDLKALEKDLCVGDKAIAMIMNDVFNEFVTRAMYDPAIYETMGIKSEDEAVKKSAEDMAAAKADVLKETPEFVSCKTQAREMSCESVFDKIAREGFMGMPPEASPDAKKLAGIAGKMGINNCVMVSMTAQGKNEESPSTAEVYFGQIGGKTNAFFLYPVDETTGEPGESLVAPKSEEPKPDSEK
jgi:hypothetical protein